MKKEKVELNEKEITPPGDVAAAAEDEENKEGIFTMHEAEKKEKDEEIAALRKSLEEEKGKTRYLPEPIPLPPEQKKLPKGIQESDIKTTVTNMSTVIKEKLLQLHDLATMEVLLESSVRMKKRLESIKKMSSAEHIKIRGMWKTFAPQMHISNLQGRKINNDEYEIAFGVYITDDKGNKQMFIHSAEVKMHDGSTIQRALSAEYRIGYEIKEQIKSGKPITREVVRIDKIQE